MPNKESPATLTLKAGTNERAIAAKDKVSQVLSSNNWMVVTYQIVDGQIKMTRYTNQFPRGDFNASITLLQDDLTAELEASQKDTK